jgi:hypothetical protein
VIVVFYQFDEAIVLQSFEVDVNVFSLGWLFSLFYGDEAHLLGSHGCNSKLQGVWLFCSSLDISAILTMV